MISKFRKRLSAKADIQGEEKQGEEKSENKPYMRYREQIKEYSLLMEFKKLKHHAPSEVYVMPSLTSIRKWDGVIIVRKGVYRKAIFKFLIDIPNSYPEQAPKIFFSQEVFHPLIRPDTGELDISVQFPVWQPNQHYIVLLLGYIKKCFYKTDFFIPRPDQEPFNKQAQTLWITKKEEFIRRCEKSANDSNNKVYDNRQGSLLVFSKPQSAYDGAYQRICADEPETKEKEFSYASWFMDGVHKLDDTLPKPFT